MPRLLVISTVRWGYLWQRHQALATAAAEDGWQVDFLQPRPRNLRQVVTYPLRMARGTRLEQDHGAPPSGVTVLSNRHWFGPLSRYDLALVYIPDRLTEATLARTRPRHLIYDAVLDWAHVPPDWAPPIGWRKSEVRLARKPNAHVITDSRGMVRVLEDRGIESRVVPPAADPPFVAAGSARSGKRAAALYFGSVRQEVDVPALTGLATAGVPVEVIGRIEEPALGQELEAGGVVVREPLPIDEIARTAAAYQVILLPYRGARSASLVPAKYWNCVATGSWVVTHGLRDIDGAANVRSTDGTADGLLECVRAALATTPPLAPVPTWSARWQEILRISAGTSTPERPAA